jgi:hypothetical protein
MKKYLLCLSALLLMLSLGCVSSDDSPDSTDNDSTEQKPSSGPTQLIVNGDVQEGTEKWGFYVNPPGEMEFDAVDGHIEYQVEDVGEENWHIQGQYAGLSMIEGGEYILTVDMRSTIPRTAQIRIQKDSDPYTGYMEEFITLSQEMQTYRFEFTMEDKSDPLSKLCFNLG